MCVRVLSVRSGVYSLAFYFRPILCARMCCGLVLLLTIAEQVEHTATNAVRTTMHLIIAQRERTRMHGANSRPKHVHTITIMLC